MIIKKLSLVFIALFLTACAALDAKGPQFQQHQTINQNKTLVYLFKPDSAARDGVTTCIALTLNEVEHGCVKGKGYIVSEIEPGTYNAALVNKAAFGFKLLEFDLTAEPGEIIYLEYAFGRKLSSESLDTRSAQLGLSISLGKHAVASISESEALSKLNTLLLSQ